MLEWEDGGPKACGGDPSMDAASVVAAAAAGAAATAAMPRLLLLLLLQPPQSFFYACKPVDTTTYTWCNVDGMVVDITTWSMRNRALQFQWIGH